MPPRKASLAKPTQKKWKLEDGDEFLRKERGDDGKKRRYYKRVTKEVVHLTTEQLDEIGEAFQLFDKDNSGMIDTEELKDAMRALGFHEAVQSRDKVRALMEKADKDGSGQIDRDEFKALMAAYIVERNPKEELQKAFKMYDDDDGGTIGVENLRRAANDLGESIKDEEIYMMLKIADFSQKYDGLEVDFD